MTGPLESRWEDPSLQQRWSDAIGPEGLAQLHTIWSRSLEIGRGFNAAGRRLFYEEDFAPFVDLAAMALRTSDLLRLRRFAFVPLRSPIFNAGAKYALDRELDIVFFWSSLYQAIRLAANQQSVICHCETDIETHPLYALYMSACADLFFGIYYFGLPYLGRRNIPRSVIELPADVGRLSWVFERHAANFVLLHEIGHVFLGHTRDHEGFKSGGRVGSQRREFEADAWAVNSFDMDRQQTDPLYLALGFQCVFDTFLLTELFEERYATGGASHPLSVARIEHVLSLLLQRRNAASDGWDRLEAYAQRVRWRHLTTDYSAVGRPLADKAHLVQAVLRSIEIRDLLAECAALTDIRHLCDQLDAVPMSAVLWDWYSRTLYALLRRERFLLQVTQGATPYREHLHFRSSTGRLVAKFEMITRVWSVGNDEEPAVRVLQSSGLLQERDPGTIQRRAEDIGEGGIFTLTCEIDEQFDRMCSEIGNPFVWAS